LKENFVKIDDESISQDAVKDMAGVKIRQQQQQ